MPCVKRSLLALAAVALLTFFPKATFASTSTTCECFCGEEGFGTIGASISSPKACQESCADLETPQRYVGCFTDQADYPDQSDKCWTEKECSDWSSEIRGERVTADWGTSMPYDCAYSKDGDQMRYCYGQDPKYQLNIAIGSVPEIENLPEYINAIYTWLLPAASLIAVVMMMIGGLQYALSRGKSKYIDKAKTRITNAITGLVILLSVFVILNLIDPRLTVLNALKIPLIKTSVILDAGSSCESLDAAGYGITPTPDPRITFCGTSGTVTDVSDLNDNAVGSWENGNVCSFQYCASGKTCIKESETNVCRSCAEITNPGTSTCGSIQKVSGAMDGDRLVYCIYDKVLNSCTTAGFDFTTSEDSVQGFTCRKLERSFANTMVSGGTHEEFEKTGEGTLSGCSAYEKLKFGYLDDDTATGRDLTITTINTKEGSTLLKKLCNEDPCSIGAFLEESYKTDVNIRCEYKKFKVSESEIQYLCKEAL